MTHPNDLPSISFKSDFSPVPVTIVSTETHDFQSYPVCFLNETFIMEQERLAFRIDD